jgi:hypothetical protein
MNATSDLRNTVGVLGITPSPTDEEMAAVIAALTLAWPQPVVVASEPKAPVKTSPWKWSGRPWSQQRF